MQKLFFRELGDPQSEPFIVLHGLFGSSDNWLTLGKRFSEDFHVYLIDQRNHGQSFHDAEFNYKAMAADLQEFFKEQGLNSAHILGHSMGGKTAMEFAVNSPERVKKLIVADISPKSYPVHHHTILKGLFAINLEELSSRAEADEILAAFVPEIGVRQFLLKNLARNGSDFVWKVNLPVIAQKIEEVGFGLNENYRFTKPTLFIRGGKSDYILDSDTNRIHTIFKDASISTIPNAGHWLHAEKPSEFYELALDFLKDKL